ncbi:unnamed protein product [Somion occarium]|uniref:Ribosome biogenesis protein NOP53 n=1 Tax=Somion occarium TaxID=3059160 RepID=A0ABP1DRP1_9APHY
MAATTLAAKATQKKSRSTIGAPSQRNQSSRKGKRAWRKNVDIDDVEEVLEEIRTEERITGSALHKKKDEDLFQIDVTGDETVRRHLPKFSTSQLTSAKILAQRSAVPAVVSRTTSSSTHKRKLTHEEKDRLLRMGKRMRKGPFNGVIDPTEMGAGSALLEVSEAVKASGGYDVWGTADESEPDFSGVVPGKMPAVKAPVVPHPRKHITVPAVPAPHEGTSYNPPVTSHQSLLLTAHEIEAKRVKEAEEMRQVRDKVEEARKVAQQEGGVLGMKLDESREQEDAEVDGEDKTRPTKKIPERKTKQERIKAAKRQAEKRALLEKVAQKRMLANVFAAKALRKSVTKKQLAREQLRTEQKQQAEQERLKKGLAGQKLGKHVVPEGAIDVQLGEELSESLRGLKPEGNLFRDRFLNMQHRALVEPRVPVLPRKRKNKMKEYEKHAFKRFDRDN